MRLNINGAPKMGYCHCDSCRHWSAGPINAFSLWAPASIQIERVNLICGLTLRLTIALESGVVHAVGIL